MRATLRRAWEKQSGWFQPHPSRKRKILTFRPLGIPPAPSPSFCVRKYTFLALIYNSHNSNSKKRQSIQCPKWAKQSATWLCAPEGSSPTCFEDLRFDRAITKTTWMVFYSVVTYISIKWKNQLFSGRNLRENQQNIRATIRAPRTISIPAFQSCETHALNFRWNNAGARSKWRLFFSYQCEQWFFVGDSGKKK